VAPELLIGQNMRLQNIFALKESIVKSSINEGDLTCV